MVRPLAATALAAAALVVTHPIPTAEAAGKSYQKGHKVELWVSKVRRQQFPSKKMAQDVLVFLFRWFFGGGSPVETGTICTDTINGYLDWVWRCLRAKEGENDRKGKRFGGHLLVQTTGEVC